MYRDLIRQNYPTLSPSYRSVADFILGTYFDVAFMTAAEVGRAVEVDTTTVVRFAQRLGYNGYPGLLKDIRDHVRSEIYAVRRPDVPQAQHVGAQFRHFLEAEQANLARTIMHNPPEQIAEVAALLTKAERFFLLGDGYTITVATTVAQQLRQWGISATVVAGGAAERAATLAQLRPGDLVIGLSLAAQGEESARAMRFAQAKGCALLAVVGDLTGPVSRAADHVLYVPAQAAQAGTRDGAEISPEISSDGQLPSVTPMFAALFALIQAVCKPRPDQGAAHASQFDKAYRFLTDGESEEGEAG